jgi:S1-C subfamily serine protease
MSWALIIDQNAPSCAWIGVEVAPMTAPVANSLGMAVPYGAIFDRPEAGSPAAKAIRRLVEQALAEAAPKHGRKD